MKKLKLTRRKIMIYLSFLVGSSMPSYAQNGLPYRDRFQSFRQTFRVEPDPEEAQRIIDNIIADREIKEDLILLQAPDIAEDGNVVPVFFKVNCSMQNKDWPKTVHFLAMDNPFPEVAKFYFTPACGEAEVAFRCRMRTSSYLIVIAEMADNTVGMTKRYVDVTLGACS